MAAHPKLIRRKPLDNWTLRERLMLASSVLQSGDQNWASVSRAIKNQAIQPRTAEYFSQKNCALQYGELLEKAETPKRKRSDQKEVVETPGMQIVRKLTMEHIEELKQEIKRQQEQYFAMSDEIDMISNGYCDDQLSEMWQQILETQKEQEAQKEIAASLADENEQRQPMSVGTIDVDNTDSQEALIDVDDQSQEAPDLVDQLTSNNTKQIANANDTISSPPVQPPAATVGDQQGETNIVTTTAAIITPKTPLTSPTITTPSTNTLTSTTTGPPQLTSPTDNKFKPIQLMGAGDSIEAVSIIPLKPDVPDQPVTETEQSKQPSSDLASAETPAKPTQEKPPSPPVAVEPTIVKTELEKALSPDSNLSSVSETRNLAPDSKKSEAGTANQSSSGNLRRRSHRANKSKEDKKDDSVSSYTHKSAGEDVDVTSEEEEEQKPVDSPPNSPATSVQCESEDDKYHKTWKKSIMMVWRMISHHKYANVFMYQVTDDIAPNYSKCVFKPMSLNLIKQNIERNVIRTTEEFTRDIMLMCINAIMYNNHEYDVYSMAQAMYDEAIKAIEQHTQTIGKEPEQKSVLLRGRRSDVATGFEKVQDLEKSKRRSSGEPLAMTELAKKRKTRADD